MSDMIKLNGVQLDLARQMETVETIKDFIDFAAEQGYNALFLYLEGRVRTRSFPYPPASASYSPEEMGEIVRHAASRNIDVIPGLACLGHAELFLKYDEMKHLAELRDGRNGRFWNNFKQVFCATSPATREFLANYIDEICEIFPSPYIHIGLDESWDIGFCDDCSKKAESFLGEQELYLDIINHCHDVVAGKHGRRMMIWDDMFELYSDILPRVPRDVIMVCWQYRADVTHVQGHFANRRVEESFSVYDRLGFDYVIGPGAASTANIRTFTRLAESAKPMGWLLTNWENSTSYIYKQLPIMAYAGRLWKAGSTAGEAQIFDDLVEDLCGVRDPVLVATLRCIYESRLLKEHGLGEGSLASYPYSGLDQAWPATLKLLLAGLTQVDAEALSPTGRLIVDDLRLGGEFHQLRCRLIANARALLMASPGPVDPAIDAEFEAIVSALEALRQTRVAQWDRFRGGIEPCAYDRMYSNAIAMIPKWVEKVKGSGLMRVRFCLPDQYSAPRCRISLHENGAWKQVASGSFKCMESTDGFYHTYILIDKAARPDAVRFSFDGYGGQGLAFVEILTDAGRGVPTELLASEGQIFNPEAVLSNDLQWAYCGDQDVEAAFHDRSRATDVHSVDYRLSFGGGEA